MSLFIDYFDKLISIEYFLMIRELIKIHNYCYIIKTYQINYFFLKNIQFINLII